MNAIRRDEDHRQHPLHLCGSVGLGKSHQKRSYREILDTLKETVRQVYKVLRKNRKIYVYISMITSDEILPKEILHL